ncbi:GAF domain-containing protein [Shouchella patagoniensis]|uniref:GAF domain-containing protein n=1 Tax=Shouchella patagoniensis TaxID=228576 RepID=UPI0009955B21|nr:GAF domain-containing protein [Shouchella patagoniensis]
MSIPTDIASLKIMAHVYKKQDTESVFEKTVESLVSTVPYIDWVGIYMYEDLNHKLVAASCFENDLRWDCNSELKFPVTNAASSEIGMMIVRTKEAIAFDVTDVSTLETIASAIGYELTLN